MNKKLLLAGAFAAAGFIGLTAFGGQTREQQEAEIAAAVTAKLDELRTQMDEQCTERVMAEAQIRYDAWLLEQAGTASKPGVGSKPKPKPGTKPPSVTPLPEPVPEKPKPTNPKEDKMNQNQSGNTTQNKTDKMNQNQSGNTTGSKKDKMNKNQGGN